MSSCKMLRLPDGFGSWVSKIMNIGGYFTPIICMEEVRLMYKAPKAREVKLPAVLAIEPAPVTPS